MKKVIAFALVLLVFMFATAITTAMITIPEINVLDRTLNVENIVPLGGDPIDDPRPPGAGTG